MQMAHHLSRRAILGMLTGLGAAVAGGTYFWTAGPESLIGKIIARRFPGVRIEAASIAALTRDIKDAKFQTLGRRLGLEGGARVAGIVGVDALARWKLTATTFSQLERKAITFFILGSDFLDVKDPKLDPVTYVEAPLVCPNRFAEYD
jgi:hypothetical protein